VVTEVWIVLEACEGDWSPIFGVFSSMEKASEALKLTRDPEIMTVIHVYIDEFKAGGWWE
jgi:hypothetical protein